MKFPNERRDKSNIEKENEKLTRRVEGIKKQIELNKLCIDTGAVKKEIKDYQQYLIKKNDRLLRENAKELKKK